MSSQVDIANRALIKLGLSTIISLSDNTNNARVINSMWSAVRDSVLREHVWRFATTRTELAALSTAPAFGYTTKYQLPSDCLRLIEVNSFVVFSLSDGISTQQSLYQIEGNEILTNVSAPLQIRYIKRETDTAQYTADFAEALACKLAVEACMALVNSVQTKSLLIKEYEEAVIRAAQVDGLEFPPQPIYDDGNVLSRY